MQKTIRVGDKICTQGRWEGLEGRVTKIREGRDYEDHGTVEIRVTRVDHDRWPHLSLGEHEHFVHWHWWETLQVLC